MSLAADPLVGDHPHLNHDNERKAIQRARNERGAAIEARSVPPTVSWLRRCLTQGQAAILLHLSCHGTIVDAGRGPLAMLVLEDDNGGPEMLQGDKLARMAPRRRVGAR